MKILVTNHQLKDRCGSELFTLNLVKELKKGGHDIFVFSPVLGQISEQISKLGIIVVNDIALLEKEKIDIIHAQHNTTAILARSIFQETPMVFMSHGVLPELEQAPSIDLGISKYLAVSEEVAENLSRRSNIPKHQIEIIRNFVDTDIFCARKPVNQTIKHLLIISNHFANEAKDIINEVSRKMDLTVKYVGYPDNPVSNVEYYINEADMVITLGRGALEAMACERNVLIYDIHGGDGLVTTQNFFLLREKNFSGRVYGRKYNANDLENEIVKFDPAMGKKLREIIVKNNTSNVIIKKLQELYVNCIREGPIKSDLKKYQLYRELKFLETPFNYQDHFNRLLGAKDNEILLKKQNILDLNKSIQARDLLLASTSSLLEEKVDQISHKDIELKQTKNNLTLKVNELYEIKKSRGWRTILFIRKISDKIFPGRTTRRKLASLLYKLCRKAFSLVRLLINIRGRKVLSKSEFDNVTPATDENSLDTKLINQYEADEFIKLVNSYKSKNEVNVSVIIATYNRANLLKELLAIWKKVAKHTSCSYELIFSDDGSDDETFEFLSKYHDLPIVVLRNPHHGAANARNHAVEKAKGELLVFTGDDIFPEVDFIEKHWSYYKKNGPFTATLGKIEWKPGIKKTYLMTHITEIGCEQFSFPAFIEYAEVDFRHFYTSNISISSNVIKGIGKTFDKAFTKCNFEDIELGYRLSKKGIKIFYTPDVVGYHDHVYSDVNKFCHRQSIAGEMLAVFKKLHPMLSKKEVGVDVDAFNQSLLEYDNNKFFDMLSILGLIGLLFFKPLTKILEVLIGVSDSVLLRRLCSFFYGRLFVFYFYNGLAIGLKPNMEVIKRMSFVFRYLWGRKDTSSASKHQNVLSLANSLPEIGAACVYIYVEINDRVIIDSYKDICRPFLPYIIVSDYPCPSMHECRTYKYSPVDSAIAMDKYSFLNMAFCLMNYGFNFIIISRGLDEWPLLTASDLRTSIVYPANFDSVDSFLESNSTVCGRFLRLKGDEREYDNIDISKYFKNYAIRNSFLYQNCEQVKPVVITEFKNRISKKKPLVFVFPALMAVGGVERNTIEVMRRLNDQIDFVVITWEGHTVQTGSLFHQLNGVCLAYFDLAQVSQFESYLDNLKALNNIYNPDIVWVPNSSPWYFQNLKSIKQIFAKVAMVSQDVYDTENGWIKYYDNPDVKKYERYIAINKKIQDKFVKRYGLPKDRIDLIYPAIDKMKIEKVNSSKFNREEVLSKYGLKSNKLNFAFIGRLTEQKQPIRFIKFAKIILSYRDDINFIIVGDGPLGQEVDLFIENHKLGDRIKKIKYLEAVYEFTKAMDGLIITSIYEGLPIVAIEAMCLGTPVMTTGVGDLPLFVDKYNIGVIATGYEVRDLETAFKKFLVGLSTFKANVVTHMNECTDFFSSQRAANLTLNCFQLAAPGILESYENKERKPYYPLVSVIIPSYNHERYIKTAVNSVLMQTYPNIELIVVDDGSKDNSVSILRTIKDKRFTLLEQENQGAHMAINRGLGMAKGDLLTILNSDDVYHPDRIRQMVALFDNEPEVGLVCSWISCIDSNGKQTGVKKGWHNMEPWPIKNGEFIKRIDNDFVRNLSASNFIATTSNMLFKRQVLNDVGGMRNLKFAHDWDFALRVAEKYQCKLIEYPLVQYRLHSTNTINTNHKHMLFEICWIYATHIPIISNTFLGAENFDSNTESLMESLNLQGNGRLVKSLIDRMRELSKKGIISPEEILLDDRKMLQTFISQVME